jgi:hypothetical protein
MPEFTQLESVKSMMRNLPPKGHRGLRAPLGEAVQARAASSRQDDRQRVAREHGARAQLALARLGADRRGVVHEAIVVKKPRRGGALSDCGKPYLVVVVVVSRLVAVPIGVSTVVFERVVVSLVVGGAGSAGLVVSTVTLVWREAWGRAARSPRWWSREPRAP